MIDYTAINAALYARVATDDAGAAVRALVSSIFPVDGLKSLPGKTLPYLAWADSDAGGSSGEMRTPGGAWWAYVGPMDTGGIRTLLAIKTALETLYGPDRPGMRDW